MEDNKEDKPQIHPLTEKFLNNFSDVLATPVDLGSGNDRTVNTALVYEKIRIALEYQEDHLVFKNAISRILRRHYTLSSRPSANQLVSDLVSELAWANYINPDAVPPEVFEKTERIVERYLILLNSARSGRFKQHELQKMVIDWLACEIDEVFFPALENNELLEFAYTVLRKKVETADSRMTEQEHELQLKVAIYGQLLRPDYAKIQYFVLRQVYPDWASQDKEEMKKIGRSFDPYFNKVDHALNHPYRRRFFSYVKRNIAPFILIKKVLLSQRLDIKKVLENPAILQNTVMDEYEKSVAEAKQKVWRGTFRALIFIFLTKISLAFIVEIPFDRYVSGTIDYLSLLINVTLPPVLMFIAGTFVKSPPVKNARLIQQSVKEIISEGEIGSKPFSLVEKKSSKSFFIFNLFYALFTIGVLFGVVWLLIFLHFNIISILLFFTFVSIVSFFSFRIRNIALELAMKRSKDDSITSTMELFFLPFVRIGKTISERFTRFNPFILMLDFLIEAPLKTVIRIMNSWLRFINAKKEEMEN